MAHEKNLNLNLSKEDELILLCARSRMKEEIKEKIRCIIQTEINWEYVLMRSSRHNLNPLLYWQLNSLCPYSVPFEVMERLKLFFQENTLKNLLFMGELKKILKIFKSYNIIAIPYKGPVLAILAYGSLSLRYFNDIDIYIQRNDIKKVKNIMIKQGYGILKSNKSYFKYQREHVFINKDNGVKIEIHWKFPVLSYSFPIDSNYLCEYNLLKKADISGFEISIPCNEDMLLILCMHNAGHLWARLSWICDIAELLENSRNLNWQMVHKKAKKLRIERILFLNLLLSREFLGIEIPKNFLSKIKEEPYLQKLLINIKRRIMDDVQSDSNVIEDFLLRLAIRENFVDKIKDLSRLMIKPFEN